jgi:hypothetical protein
MENDKNTEGPQRFVVGPSVFLLFSLIKKREYLRKSLVESLS